MEKNTRLFFQRAKEFQDARAGIVDNYEDRLSKLNKAKGTRFYEDETAKARESRDKALNELKNEYSGYFRSILEAMSKANGSRGIKPPTEEELRTLQLIKMKDNVTEAELDAAAVTLKGNSTCLSVLTEIGRKAGFLRGYANYAETKEMPARDVEETIRGLHGSLRDFMDHDTSRAARTAQKRYEMFYGTTQDETTLAKRPLFETKEECFDIVCGLTGDAYEAFCDAVDGQ